MPPPATPATDEVTPSNADDFGASTKDKNDAWNQDAFIKPPAAPGHQGNATTDKSEPAVKPVKLERSPVPNSLQPMRRKFAQASAGN
jgi:hypothetical protein